MRAVCYSRRMEWLVRKAKMEEEPEIRELIRASVRGLQEEYTERQRELALNTVFRVDTQLLRDGTYFVVEDGAGGLAACGGWSYRHTLCGPHDRVDTTDEGRMDPAKDRAKIRAIFVHPRCARQGLGSLVLERAEEAAVAAGFREVEMGSTLTGVHLYRLRGYEEVERFVMGVGEGEEIGVVKMVKRVGVGE